MFGLYRSLKKGEQAFSNAIIMSNRCSVCNWKVKEVKKPYVIKRRDPNKKEIIIHNLKFYHCEVCTMEKMTDESESIVNAFKQKIVDEYNELPKEIDEPRLSTFEVFKKLLSF